MMGAWLRPQLLSPVTSAPASFILEVCIDDSHVPHSPGGGTVLNTPFLVRQLCRLTQVSFPLPNRPERTLLTLCPRRWQTATATSQRTK